MVAEKDKEYERKGKEFNQGFRGLDYCLSELLGRLLDLQYLILSFLKLPFCVKRNVNITVFRHPAFVIQRFPD